MSYMDLYSVNLDLLCRKYVSFMAFSVYMKCLNLNTQHGHNWGKSVVFLRDTKKIKQNKTEQQ